MLTIKTDKKDKLATVQIVIGKDESPEKSYDEMCTAVVEFARFLSIKAKQAGQPEATFELILNKMAADITTKYMHRPAPGASSPASGDSAPSAAPAPSPAAPGDPEPAGPALTPDASAPLTPSET